MVNAVLRAKQARDDGGRYTKGKGFPWSDLIKAEICRRLIEGATTREVCNDPAMPDRYELFRELNKDEAFATAYATAKSEAPAALLDIAVDYATEATAGSVDDMRKAEAYARVISTYAEKLAPRKYGALLKLGQADELAPLAIEIVSYAKPKPAETEDNTQHNAEH